MIIVVTIDLEYAKPFDLLSDSVDLQPVVAWSTHLGSSLERPNIRCVAARSCAIGAPGELTPNVQSPIGIMKGDVHVLRRIQQQDKKAEKASRLLIKKLSRKRRNQHKHSMLKSPHIHTLSFASEANFVKHNEMSVVLRRLVKARDDNDKRAFYVDELGCDMDEPLTLLVAPRSKDACEHLVAKRATKNNLSMAKCSSYKVCMLEACTGSNIQLGNNSSSQVIVQKLHMDNGVTLFYAYTPNTRVHDASPPWSLGLDRATFTQIQSKLVRMLGAELVV